MVELKILSLTGEHLSEFRQVIGMNPRSDHLGSDLNARIESKNPIRFFRPDNFPSRVCDPHAPWQRATNENTNGLLRQYFPKSSDLSAHSADDLDWVAAELNDRPRKRLGFKKPIEQIGPLLLR